MIPKMINLEDLINETLEDLYKKYPLDDHQSLMRASFEIFASQLLWRAHLNQKRGETNEWELVQFRWVGK